MAPAGAGLMMLGVLVLKEDPPPPMDIFSGRYHVPIMKSRLKQLNPYGCRYAPTL